jgi:NTE family protein
MEPTDKTITKCKHLVISGGGPSGLTAYGALRKTNELGLWTIDDVESIYGTSMGSIIGVVLALKYDWETTSVYLMKRPWQQLVKYDIHTIFSAFSNRGVFNINVIEETFRPLFNGMDISMNITMKEFYELTKIELHIYTTNVNDLCLVDLSYKTHPSWTIVEAVYASSCLPVIFTPFAKDGQYYMDGGIFLNYPLEPCIRDHPNTDEILGIRKQYIKSTNDNISETSNMADYILMLLNKTLKLVTKDVDISMIKHEIAINSTILSIVDLLSMITSEEFRNEKVEQGMKEADEQCVHFTETVQEVKKEGEDRDDGDDEDVNTVTEDV